MGYIQHSFCDNCGYCLRSGTGIPLALNEKGEIAAIRRSAPYDGVFSTERLCKHCKTEVKTYNFRTDSDELWGKVVKLKGKEYVSQKDLDNTGFEFSDVDYLEEKGILGPEKKHHFFFKHRKVLLNDQHKKEELVPKFVYKADGSCVQCGKKDFYDTGDMCPRCEKGTFVYDEEEDLLYN